MKANRIATIPAIRRYLDLVALDAVVRKVTCINNHRGRPEQTKTNPYIVILYIPKQSDYKLFYNLWYFIYVVIFTFP